MGTDYAETREIFLNFVLKARTFPRDWSVARNQPISIAYQYDVSGMTTKNE